MQLLIDGQQAGFLSDSQSALSSSTRSRRLRLVKKDLDINYLVSHCEALQAQPTDPEPEPDPPPLPPQPPASRNRVQQTFRKSTTLIKNRVRQGWHRSTPPTSPRAQVSPQLLLPTLEFESIFKNKPQPPPSAAETHRSNTGGRRTFRRGNTHRRRKKSGAVPNPPQNNLEIVVTPPQHSPVPSPRPPLTARRRRGGRSPREPIPVPNPVQREMEVRPRRKGSKPISHTSEMDTHRGLKKSGRKRFNFDGEEDFISPEAVEKATAQSQKVNYTGPGFAQIPTPLARSPTARFIGRISRNTSEEMTDCGKLGPMDSMESNSMRYNGGLDALMDPNGSFPSPTTSSSKKRDRIKHVFNRSRSRASTNADTVILTTPIFPPATATTLTPDKLMAPSKVPFIDRLFNKNNEHSINWRRRHSIHILSQIDTGVTALHEDQNIGEQRGESPHISNNSFPRPVSPPKRLTHRALSVLGFAKKIPPSGTGTSQPDLSNYIDDRLLTELDMGNLNCCGARTVCNLLLTINVFVFQEKQLPKDPHFRDEAAAFLHGVSQEEFDSAYAKNDIEALVRLIESREPFSQSSTEVLHPWASAVQCIGALATTQIAALAASENAEVKRRIVSSGAIPLLINELTSDEDDRADAALVALSFLCIDYPSAATQCLEAGIFPPLIKQMQSAKVGARAAAAQTARNIYVLEPRYRRIFRDAGGCQPLVNLLGTKAKHNGGSMDQDVVIEALYHIDDFLMVRRKHIVSVDVLFAQSQGEEIPDCVAAIKACNAAAILEAIQKSPENREMQEVARQLYLRLAD